MPGREEAKLEKEKVGSERPPVCFGSRTQPGPEKVREVMRGMAAGAAGAAAASAFTTEAAAARMVSVVVRRPIVMVVNLRRRCGDSGDENPG